MRFSALAAAAVTVGGLSVGVATAGSTPGSTAVHPVIHGTGGLRPDIRLPRGNKPAVSAEGLPIQYSGNWSGYIALPKPHDVKNFRGISASYNVPSANCGVTPTAFAYQWVGLDGDTNGTVEQDGVASYCVSGSPTYFAWSEMYPAGVDVQFYLNPGDAVNSSVNYDPSTQEFTLALTDVTSGQSFSVDEACASTCPRTSAEAITEGYPSGSYGGTSDFGAEHYDSIRVTGGAGSTSSLTNGRWLTDESIAQGATSDTTTAPGPLYTTTAPKSPLNSAFEDLWYSED
ncbi:MAG TPA: G1 family glutamic endopeptidase [Streptosporangiaceae bacterium]